MRAASLVNLKHILVPEAAPYLVSTKNSDLWLAENTKQMLCACSENRPRPEVTILGADQKKRGL